MKYNSHCLSFKILPLREVPPWIFFCFLSPLFNISLKSTWSLSGLTHNIVKTFSARGTYVTWCMQIYTLHASYDCYFITPFSNTYRGELTVNLWYELFPFVFVTTKEEYLGLKVKKKYPSKIIFVELNRTKMTVENDNRLSVILQVLRY